MKKLIALCLICMIAGPLPVYAEEEELLTRIKALEERVTYLEEMLGVSEQTEQEVQMEIVPEDSISLGVGTWIVGEDLPAGKYSIICTSGSGMVQFYNTYNDRKESPYSHFESYYMASAAFVESVTAFYEGTDSFETVKSMYTTEVNNIRLEEGNCIYSEVDEITFVTVK